MQNASLHKLWFVFPVLMVLAACQKDEDPEMCAEFDDTPYILTYPDHVQDPNIPENNPLTEAGVRLGRMLFYEPLLSRDGTQSCASCHVQANGFSDTAQFSIGVNGLPGGRQAMGVINLAWNSNGFFWDGRAPLLRHQSLMPIEDELEMDETLPNVVAKLENIQDYREQFIRAFGTEVITPERMGLAMEQFMNSVIGFDSKFDQVQMGLAEFTESEERGRELYFTEFNPFFPEDSGADCAHCHGGSNFENDKYMNNGLDADGQHDDEGFAAVTGDPMDIGKFKVTTLRNIALTPPYMHDGRFETLEEVVAHYNSGVQASATLDPALMNTVQTGLMLDDQDVADLVAFLHTLTDQVFIANPAYSDPH